MVLSATLSPSETIRKRNPLKDSNDDGEFDMDDRERCPKNPSMLKAYCSHCQGTQRGTMDNPTYSIKEGLYHGFPVVEVLKNGGSVHMWDSHFRFGLRKAEMLIACSTILREFGWATDDERLAFKSQLIENQRRGLRIQVYIVMHPEFEHSSGETIERPWLRLEALPPDKDHIGLGMIKCRAISAVEADLKRWLARHGVQ